MTPMKPTTVFKIGDYVRTRKGCRFNGSFAGVIVKIGKKWGDYEAVVVQKDSGKKVLCLLKNLEKPRTFKCTCCCCMGRCPSPWKK